MSLLVIGAVVIQAMLTTVFDFSDSEQVDAWTIVDDGVMGGISQGNWYQEEDYVVFEGNISLENNGGFSSVRVGFRPADLSAYDGIALKVRGDGQTYAFGLRDMNNRYDYRLSFETTSSEELLDENNDTDEVWETIYIPFDELVANFFGQQVPSAAPFDASRARGMTLIISDKQEGEFRLEIASIALYTEDESAETE